MDEHRSIVTPDHIELDFELAGLGSRFLALIMDAVLIGLLIIALVLIAVILGLGSIARTASMSAGSWVLAFAIFAYFVLMWGYFLFFEALNNGQTPGKRWAGIRVVRDDGLPVRWRESALRNLVRAADILPPPACIVGGLAIILSKDGKRLGDLLAGTIVVTHDAQLEPTQRTSRWGAAWIVKVEKGRSRQGMMIGDTRVDASQLQIIERFLGRRDSLPVHQRQTLAWRIASPFLAALGEDPVELAKRPDRFKVCEESLKKIMALADSTPQTLVESVAEDAADAKRRQWREFNHRIDRFARGGKRSLLRLAPHELAGLMGGYRPPACDLARAPS